MANPMETTMTGTPQVGVTELQNLRDQVQQMGDYITQLEVERQAMQQVQQQLQQHAQL